VRLEVRKVLFSPWALIGWGLALMPVLLLAARVAVVFLLRQAGEVVDIPLSIREGEYAAVYQTLLLRLCVFFGCLAIFINLFRGEVHNRTLHYYLLAPVRREVLVAGKFLGGLVGAAFLFGGATLATRLLLLVTPGAAEASRLATAGPWLGHTLAYLGVTLLACGAYGAMFLVIGILPVNPIVPAVMLLGWESANTFLPATLQSLSVVRYLVALCPVPLDLGPIAVVSQPVAWPAALAALLALTALLVGAAMRRARGMEAEYGRD